MATTHHSVNQLQRIENDKENTWENRGLVFSFHDAPFPHHLIAQNQAHPLHHAAPSVSLWLRGYNLLSPPHFLLSLCCLVNSNSFFRSLLRYHILHEA